jgi:hypothetical protein
MSTWSVLFTTLPTQPNSARLRIWRALKGRGAVALRDGVYLLPKELSNVFESLAQEIIALQGTAQVMSLTARDDVQRDEILARFDRHELYLAWEAQALAFRRKLNKTSESEARRGFRGIGEDLLAITAIDYYPGQEQLRCTELLEDLRHQLEQQFSTGEPTAQSASDLPRLNIADFQNQRWVTRERPWVDRLACAWFIRRFVDKAPSFTWLKAREGTLIKTPRGAIGFDYDGARFSHVGSRVSFEVMIESFGFGADPALQRMAPLVRYLDVGGKAHSEAIGLERILQGLRQLHVDDDALLQAASVVFDAIHAAGLSP